MPTPSDDYDLEPVKYCARCYSLKVKYEEAIDSDCCMECGCSDMAESSIYEWEKLYEKRYGHKYTVKNDNPRDSLIFNLPLKELKKKVFESPAWIAIIHAIYPGFPGGLSKTDSVILFFDKLIKDNQLDSLKFLLLKQTRKSNHGKDIKH